MGSKVLAGVRVGRALGVALACGLASTAAAFADRGATRLSGTTAFDGIVSFQLAGGRVAGFSFTAPDCLKESGGIIGKTLRNFRSKPISPVAIKRSRFSVRATVTLFHRAAASETATYVINGTLASLEQGGVAVERAKGTIAVSELSRSEIDGRFLTRLTSCSVPTFSFTASS